MSAEGFCLILLFFYALHNRAKRNRNRYDQIIPVAIAFPHC